MDNNGLGALRQADRAFVPDGIEPVPVSPVPASIPSVWQERAAQGVVDLIREVGLYKLGGCDGCPCTDLEVQNVHINVSCHKSGDHGVRVWSHHCDFSDESYRRVGEAFRPIADEVLRQVDDYYGANGEYAATFSVKFTSYEEDHPQGIAARSDETQSGSAVGKSPVAESDAPTPTLVNQGEAEILREAAFNLAMAAGELVKATDRMDRLRPQREAVLAGMAAIEAHLTAQGGEG